VVDLDLEKFFDRVNHDILMSRVARRIGDKRLLRIIRRFLQAGMMQDGVCVARDEGTPQGGPLSPLLANLLLDDLDQELERRGHCFCRYADDCNIYVRSLAAGQRVMESVVRFLEEKTSAARQPRKECGRSGWGTQVPRPSAPLERQAGDRSHKHPTREGESPADHPSESGR
jgi:retron-type reverse transcriptase